jgi:tetratricopeptide (TPR) repeat protein
MASVIGRQFLVRLLARVAGLSERLEGLLRELQALEIIYEQGLVPEPAYMFKHAVIQDVAYNSLLMQRRKALHRAVGEAIEDLYHDRLEEHYTELAHHFSQGEVWEKAYVYWQHAGEKAMTQSAYREAVGGFEQALIALQHLPEDQDTLAQAIDLRFALRLALVPLGEFGRIFDTLCEAERLAETLGDPRRLGWATVYMINYCHIRGDYDRALASSQRARALVTASGDLALQVETHFHLGHVYHALGDYRQAIDVLQRNVAALTGELRREPLGLPGLAAVLSRTWLVRCLTEVGAFAEGRVLVDEAIQMAETADHPFSRVEAYSSRGRLALRQGDASTAVAMFARGLGVCQDAHIHLLLPFVASDLGAAYLLAGRMAEALPLLEQAVAQTTTTGRVSHLALFTVQLGRGYLRAGRLEDALQRAHHALTLTRTHKERGYQAHTLRLLGEIHVQHRSPDVTPAETHYRQALALAEELGMRPLQAHCHHGLGTIYAMAGQREQARTALSTAIEMYTSMEMTFWLQPTEAALAQVEGQ